MADHSELIAKLKAGVRYAGTKNGVKTFHIKEADATMKAAASEIDALRQQLAEEKANDAAHWKRWYEIENAVCRRQQDLIEVLESRVKQAVDAETRACIEAYPQGIAALIARLHQSKGGEAP